MPDLLLPGIGTILLLIGGAFAFDPAGMVRYFREDDGPEISTEPHTSEPVHLGVRLFGFALVACGLSLIYVSVFGTNPPTDDIPGL